MHRNISRLVLVMSVVVLVAGTAAFPNPEHARNEDHESIARFERGDAPEVLAFTPVLRIADGPVDTTKGLRTPTALAAADLDGDGAIDLVAAFAADGAGLIEIHPGNTEVRLPPAARTNRIDTPSFTACSAVLRVPLRPDLVLVGDFQVDGRRDLLVAERGVARLVLLPGVGNGMFGEQRSVELDGGVTAMAAGEIHVPDGLTDLVVGVSGVAGGPRLLVYQSSRGALRAPPVSHVLPGSADEIVLGRLDSSPFGDAAALCGETLAVLRGVASNRGGAAGPVVELIDLGADALAMAAGNFLGDPGDELAIVDAAGFLRVLDLRSETMERSFVHLMESPDVGVRLRPGRFSGQRHDDLNVVIPTAGRVEVYASERLPGDAKTVGDWTPLGVFRAPGGLADALAVAVDFDAFDDFVMLDAATGSPAAALRKTLFTYRVNQTGDEDDGSCTHGHCTLREAIRAANFDPVSADTIIFEVGSSVIMPDTQLPTISGLVVIDGAQPVTEAPPQVMTVIDGSNLASGDGLVVTSSSSTLTWLAVGGFPESGVVLGVGSDNLVSHCYLGLDADGDSANGNDIGLELVNSSSNTIGGPTIAGRNIISGNTTAGIKMRQLGGDPAHTAQNLVIGNRIGTNAAGNAAVGNGIGVLLDGVADNDVGGPDGGNLISGNAGDGVVVTATGSLNDILGNQIGTSVTGSSALGNGGHGVRVAHNPWTQVGGADPTLSNLISGNALDGVHFEGASSYGLWVRGNRIGTNADGTAALANGGDGVYVAGGMRHKIGGDSPAYSNVISGNAGNGLVIAGTGGTSSDDWSTVQGNLIGTDSAAGTAIANGGHGMLLDEAEKVLIGGIDVGHANVISANGGDGMHFEDHTTQVDVYGNFVGTGPNGEIDLGNTRHGVHVGDGCNTILIGIDLGNPPSSAGNTIAFNGEDGVSVFANATSPIQITGNTIHSNTHLGIDLGGTGVTHNDPGDPDTGPNELLNFPVLTSVAVDENYIQIFGGVDTDPLYGLAIDLYASRTCDPTLHGEGEVYLGGGWAGQGVGHPFSYQHPPVSPFTPYVTAVATVVPHSERLGPTSEFSQCFEATFTHLIFADDFEGGTTAAWTEMTP